MVVGAVSLAEFAHHVAKGYSVNIALSHRPLCRGGRSGSGGAGNGGQEMMVVSVFVRRPSVSLS